MNPMDLDWSDNEDLQAEMSRPSAEDSPPAAPSPPLPDERWPKKPWDEMLWTCRSMPTPLGQLVADASKDTLIQMIRDHNSEEELYTTAVTLVRDAHRRLQLDAAATAVTLAKTTGYQEPPPPPFEEESEETYTLAAIARGLAEIEAYRWYKTIRNVEERNAVVQEAGQPSPWPRKTWLTVGDARQPIMPLDQDFLHLMPDLHCLELVAGWEHWTDFMGGDENDDDDHRWLWQLRDCSMTFRYGLSTEMGLPSKWGVMGLRFLKKLELINLNEIASLNYVITQDLDMDQLKNNNNNALESLTLRGVDIKSMGRMLELTPALRDLKIHFDTFCPRDVANTFIADSTEQLINSALGPVYGSLRTLEFHHILLTNFKWGRFKWLNKLAVWEENFFPYFGRPLAGLTVEDLIPPLVSHLTITGCKFGVPGNAVDKSGRPVLKDRLQAALECLADELLAKNLDWRSKFVVTLKISRQSKRQAPLHTREKFRLINVKLNIEEE